MPCSICGIHGHNKKTCGQGNTMPTNSAFYGDYKKTVKKNWDHAKSQKQASGRPGPVFQKNYSAMKKGQSPFQGYCTFK